MLRIAFIAGSYQPNRCGVSDYTHRLRDELSQHGVRSVVLATHEAARLSDEPNVWGVVNDWRLSDLLPLARAVQSTPAEILHIQHAAGSYRFQRPLFLLPPILRMLGYSRPIVTTVHEYGWWEWEPAGIPRSLLNGLKQWGQRRGWWDREDGFLLTGSQALITTNARIEGIICERLPYLRDRLHTIPIGANVEVTPIERSQARQQLRQRYGWSEGTFILSFFGFLHPVKGLETLLTAFQQICAQAPQARLVLIGGVESLALQGEEAQRYWQQLEERIAELELDQQVKMTGYVNAESASQYLSGSDLGVLPFNHGVTLKSGSLLTLLAHSLPVIATQKELLDPELSNEKLIRLVPPRDATALVDAALSLIHNPTLRDRMAATGRDFARRFNWAAIAKQHLEVYQSVLPANPEL